MEVIGNSSLRLALATLTPEAWRIHYGLVGGFITGAEWYRMASYYQRTGRFRGSKYLVCRREDGANAVVVSVAELESFGYQVAREQ